MAKDGTTKQGRAETTSPRPQHRSVPMAVVATQKDQRRDFSTKKNDFLIANPVLKNFHNQQNSVFKRQKVHRFRFQMDLSIKNPFASKSKTKCHFWKSKIGYCLVFCKQQKELKKSSQGVTSPTPLPNRQSRSQKFSQPAKFSFKRQKVHRFRFQMDLSIKNPFASKSKLSNEVSLLEKQNRLLLSVLQTAERTEKK